MKKNKKIFITSWFYLFASFICISAPIILQIWMIIDNNNSLSVGIKIFSYISCPLAFIFFLTVLGFLFIQWITVDEEKVVSRNLFKIIREFKWEELTEIKPVSIGYTPIHPKFKWFILVDSNEGEINLASPFNIKGKYIKIKNTKRSREIIKKHRPDLMIE